MADPCCVLAAHLRGAAILLVRVLPDKIDVQVMIKLEVGARRNYVPSPLRIVFLIWFVDCANIFCNLKVSFSLILLQLETISSCLLENWDI